MDKIHISLANLGGFMKLLRRIKDWIRQNRFFQKVFEEAIWKAKNFDMAMSAIELNTESKFEESRHFRLETERAVTMNVDVIKLLNSLGIVVSDTVKLNIIDNRDVSSNKLKDENNNIEVTIG